MDAQTSARIVDQYPSFADLARSETLGTDYRITVARQPASRVAIIAPHGGSIERRTSAITRAIAKNDFHHYLFEGLDASGSFEDLHITSHRFDEPSCLRLIADADYVVAVHGCSGARERVMLGGLDHELIARFAAALEPIGPDVLTDNHPYPGRHRLNICNRGRRERGVQLELSDGLRGSEIERNVVTAVRRVLLQLGA